MSGIVIAQLVLQYGVPAAEAIWKMTQATTISQADWDNLKAMTSQTAKDRAMVALKAAGIDPASPAGLSFLTLAS